MPEKSEKDKEKTDKLRQLLKHGTEIAGGAVGGAMGFLIGGPVGAVIGGAGGPMAAIPLRSIGQEIIERQLGSREKVRVGAAFAIVAANIHQRIENGESVRTDSFFAGKHSGRSDAEEVAESVLLKVQREPEEQKIPYMGYLLASIAFNSQITVPMAHQLVKGAEHLTYPQLCILKLSMVKDNFELRENNYRGQASFNRELYHVLYECNDLYRKGFINFGGTASLGITDVTPRKMTVQGLGADIFNLMNLSLIPDQDIVPIAT